MVKPKGFVHRSPTFLVPETSFLEDSFSMDWWWGDGLGMIQAYYAYCTLYYYCVCVCSVSQLCQTLCDPTNCSLPGSSSVGFSRQEYWSGLPLPPPGDLPNPGIEPLSPASPALAVIFFTTEPPGKPFLLLSHCDM